MHSSHMRLFLTPSPPPPPAKRKNKATDHASFILIFILYSTIIKQLEAQITASNWLIIYSYLKMKDTHLSTIFLSLLLEYLNSRPAMNTWSPNLCSVCRADNLHPTIEVSSDRLVSWIVCAMSSILQPIQ